ncbi:MAG: hypothetical protein ACI9LM_003884 [Alteromonadaceae bacterium]|jgi:hypothetical protein
MQGSYKMFANNRHFALRFATIAKNLKQKLLLQNIIQTLPWILAVMFMAYGLSLSNHYLWVALSLIVAVRLLVLIKSKRYQDVTIENVALHLNRQYQGLEESTQLMLIGDSQLSPLQILQKQRIAPRLNDILTKDNNELIPRIIYRASLHQSLWVITIGVIIPFVVDALLSSTLMKQPAVNTPTEKLQNPLPQVATVNITVIAPEYTGLKNKKNNSLNIELIEGAVIRWQITFNNDQQDYFIKFADGTLNQLLQQTDKSYLLEKIINFSGIYQIVTKERSLANIYTLTVIKDKKPRIRILTPKKTITEIATNGFAELITKVQISDDFLISNVEILASIAKGTGESVKFRDQVFSFDSKEMVDGVELYQKNWQLTSLGMAPGDELYFTIKAWDNRQPQMQMTRSTTKIIRWLEDEEQGVLSDGILIDFMPEYFKSQRQIIIETIELIADKKELSKAHFAETSELLGIAQSDLKEKYGQYLGDEVEDGGGGHAISTAASAGIAQASGDSEESHENHDSAGNNDRHDSNNREVSGHQHQAEHSTEHSTDTFEMNAFGNDRSGLSDNIARFGHNHGDADIGIVSRQDPKALMKRSISAMWQAELHLMLADPEKALPFEQEALTYLKMAKKAERIYVKRLGFEPPPVSEQRRYQGDLNDILSYQRNEIFDMTDNESKALSDLFILLNEHLNLNQVRQSHANTIAKQQLSHEHLSHEQQSTQQLSNKSLSTEQRKLIQTVKKQFEMLLVTRPALLKMVAILERILLANSFNLAECQGCQSDQHSIATLSAKIWQLLPQANAMPSIRDEVFSNSDRLFKKYSSFLANDLKTNRLADVPLNKKALDKKPLANTKSVDTVLNKSLRDNK